MIIIVEIMTKLIVKKKDKINYDNNRGNAMKITITLMIIISTTIMAGSVVTINTKL